jgi:hypothetical protein
VEGHVALVALAEVGDGVLGPLVGLGQQHAIGVVGVDMPAHLLEELVRLRQVLAIGALAFHQVRNSIEPESVYSHLQPEPHHLPHLLPNCGIVVVKIWLVTEKSMPVKRF